MDVDLETLDGLLKPRSVAVVGASASPSKIGYTVVKNLIESRYEGKIYPINPTADEILGFKCYPSVLDVPDAIDAAAIVVPAKAVPEVAEQCGQKGVKGLVIIASGFSEVGEKELEEQVIQTSLRYGTRVLGPNIVGILSNLQKYNLSFSPFLPFPGHAALVSQSGALLVAMTAVTYVKRVGFDKLISIGNMADIDFGDIIGWLAQDADTQCITLYIEGLKDGRKFIQNARRCKKPIIALKAGVSAHGAAAAASHTGSLAGAAKLYDAAFKQAGVVRADGLNTLFDRALALSLQPPMKGDNLLIITNGGGVGVMATDAAERFGIPLQFAPPDVQEELKKHMPPYGSAKNPADLTGMAGREWYQSSIENSLKNDWVDGLAVLFCETALNDPQDVAQGIEEAIAKAGVNKPVCVSFIGGEKSLEAMRWLLEQRIPAYDSPDKAVNSMAALREYTRFGTMAQEEFTPYRDVNKAKVRGIINAARAEGRVALTELEAKEVFQSYGMPVTFAGMAKNEQEAIQYATDIGFPVVMKISSPDILHKSDAGGVRVNLRNAQDVRQAYATIMANARDYDPDANIYGVVVQEMAPYGTELIIGSVNDPQFGPTAMFGLGGIFVEVLKDVTFRVAPVTVNQAMETMREINGYPILRGARGETPRDVEAIARTLSRFSQLIYDFGDEIAETDANPIIVYEQGKGLKVVDARIILTKK